MMAGLCDFRHISCFQRTRQVAPVISGDEVGFAKHGLLSGVKSCPPHAARLEVSL